MPQDHEKAAYWLRKAAEQGDAAAAYDLAALYHDGDGAEQDHDEFLKWTRKAADQGSPDAEIVPAEPAGPDGPDPARDPEEGSFAG